MKLDLVISSFERQCFDVNEVLMSRGLFLRAYELRKRFTYLIHITVKKNDVVRDLSSCAVEKFSGFEIVKKLKDKNIKREYQRIDIVYIPAKHHKDKINCFFTNAIHKAYRTTFSVDKKEPLSIRTPTNATVVLTFSDVKAELSLT